MVWVGSSVRPAKRVSMVPSGRWPRRPAAQIASSSQVVVVFPLVPVTPSSVSSLAGLPVEVRGDQRERLPRVRAPGRPARRPAPVAATTTAIAPFCLASAAKFAPSEVVPGTATKRSPGFTLRESWATPVTSSAPGSRTAARHQSPPTLRSTSCTFKSLLRVAAPSSERHSRPARHVSARGRRLRHHPSTATKSGLQGGRQQARHGVTTDLSLHIRDRHTPLLQPLGHRLGRGGLLLYLHRGLGWEPSWRSASTESDGGTPR